MLREIIGLISFLTILPLNIHYNIPKIAKYTWLFPIIGAIIGTIGGIITIILQLIKTPPIIIASLIYGFLIWFTGFHHLDGLIDMGDALMAHGTPEDKLKIMKDNRIGTGGLGLFLIIALTTFTCIYSIPIAKLPTIIIISEIGAKMGLVSSCIISKPQEKGIGRHFIKEMDKKKFILSSLLSSIIGFSLLKYQGLIGILASIIGGLFIGAVARKNFKYTTGDVLGASNEFNRMTTLLSITIAINWVNIC
ncbi:MAG TPA: adenosylcobinamide-GDP ribazoletransferase [Methanothermobacter sp.]|nr:cobalamin synthase [Methanothermobacter sp. MT-2]HHW04560.1 adenosylcobinamide-GDP ribazoletransferase [Methanothermobacter sp.]HOK72024.1 adenosylcobinamide-GDP ribazoletransferase [Methanothermobacter sp.]HOL68337.1 adenosylcobinamide-GDP ribazoletransferase [Methanothermobacter sp.]HPQ04095.1 adenosylcobinamide-GDP ribazoletransferase [Methanothermobacter sp.]